MYVWINLAYDVFLVVERLCDRCPCMFTIFSFNCCIALCIGWLPGIECMQNVVSEIYHGINTRLDASIRENNSSSSVVQMLHFDCAKFNLQV